MSKSAMRVKTAMLNLSRQVRILRDRIASCLIALLALFRGLPRLACGRPRTPLRVLCIVTFDMLHRQRTGNWMPASIYEQLAALLDFGACANAFFDQKKNSRSDWHTTLEWVEEAGLGTHAARYLRRLTELEGTRPQPWGSISHFQRVRFYREEVIRLSIAMVATTALGNRRITEAVEATHQQGTLNLLFRIVMQCQIIDDLLDYRQDRSWGLPSFLTACHSFPHALELTRQASLEYADDRLIAPRPPWFPLRIALACTSLLTRLLLRVCRAVTREEWKAAKQPA